MKKFLILALFPLMTLTHAQLKPSEVPVQAKVYVNCDFSNKDLSNQNFKNASITNCDMSGANLSNSNFQNSTLVNFDLSNANLKNTDFKGASMVNVNTEGATTK